MALIEEMLASELRSKIEEVRLEYLNSMARIVFTRDIQNLVVGDSVVEEAKKGDVMHVRRWIGEKLVSLNLAEWGEDEITLQQLLQIEWRERHNLQDLQQIPKYFYREALRIVEKNKDKRAAEKVKDILKLRMAKIVQHAIKGKRSEVVKKLTPEEEILYNYIALVSEEWRKLTFQYEADEE